SFNFMRMKRKIHLPCILFILVAALPGFFAGGEQQRPQPAKGALYRGWTAYGGGPEQIRYSSLQQINRANVKQLEVAWTYDTAETGGLQTQPVIVDGIMYAYTPTHKTFALRASTGQHLWTFDPKIIGRGPNRAVLYWAGGNDKRIFAAVDQYVYALDARMGVP